MARRIHLGNDLKHRFQEQRRPVSRVAQDLGLSVNSLRSWIRRNVYPKDQLVRIADAAGIRGDIQALTEKYDFELARGRLTYGRRLAELSSDASPERDEVLAVILNRWRVFQEGGAGVPQELRALFRALRPHDIYICCFGDALPAEWTGTGWGVLGVELATAVRRGTCLVYLFPSAETVRRLRSYGLYEYLDPESVDGAIAQFRTRVAKSVPDISKPELADQILALRVHAGTFIAPRHQYIVVTGTESNTRDSAGFLRISESSLGGSPPLMPLGLEVVSGLLSMLLSSAEHSGCQSLVARLGRASP